jgi:hypothetical protein
VNIAQKAWDATTAAGAAIKGLFLTETVAQGVATEGATVAQEGLNVAMELNPIALIVTALVALAAGFVIAYNKSATFREIVQSGLHGVVVAAKAVADFFTKDIPAAFNAVIDWVKKNWPLLGEILLSIFLPGGVVIAAIIHFHSQILGFFKAIPGEIGGLIGPVVDFITAPFKAAFNAIASLWNNTIGKLSFSIPSWVPGVGGKGFSVPNIPTGGSSGSTGFGNSLPKHFARGGIVPGVGTADNVPAFLTPGELVVPRGQVGKPADIVVHQTISLDGRQIYQTVMRHAQANARRNGTTGLAGVGF